MGIASATAIYRSRKNGDGEISGFYPTFRLNTVGGLTILFVAIGLIPQNEIVEELVTLNPRGYVDAGENCLTNKAGIFVAGDCRSKKIRQVATACADGAVAAIAACDYVDSL